MVKKAISMLLPEVSEGWVTDVRIREASDRRLGGGLRGGDRSSAGAVQVDFTVSVPAGEEPSRAASIKSALSDADGVAVMQALNQAATTLGGASAFLSVDSVRTELVVLIMATTTTGTTTHAYSEGPHSLALQQVACNLPLSLALAIMSGASPF